MEIISTKRGGKKLCLDGYMYTIKNNLIQKYIWPKRPPSKMAEPKRPWPKRPSPKRPSPKRPWPKRPTFHMGRRCEEFICLAPA